MLQLASSQLVTEYNRFVACESETLYNMKRYNTVNQFESAFSEYFF